MQNVFSSMRATFGKARAVAAVAIGVGVLMIHTAHAEANSRYAGFVIDANNGQVLYEDRADEYRYPASLTKMMTLYLTFDALSKGRIKLRCLSRAMRLAVRRRS